MAKAMRHHAVTGLLLPVLTLAAAVGWFRGR